MSSSSTVGSNVKPVKKSGSIDVLDKARKVGKANNDGSNLINIVDSSRSSFSSETSFNENIKAVEFLDLFKYATFNEKVMLFAATFLSMAIGALMPCFTILFGTILNELASLLGGINIKLLLGNVINLNFNSIVSLATNHTPADLKPFFGQIQKSILDLFGPDLIEKARRFWLSSVGLMEIGNYALHKFIYLDVRVEQVAILLALMGCMGFVWAALQKTYIFCVSHEVSMRLRKLYFKSAMRQDMVFYDQHQPGEISIRLSSDLALIEKAIGENLGAFFTYLGVAICGFVVAFVFSWRLALAFVGLSPLIAGAGAFMSYIASISAAESSDMFANAGAVAEEALTLIRTVTAFGRQETESKKFRKDLDGCYKEGIRRNIIFGAGSGGSMFIIIGANAWGMWYANQLVLMGTVNAGQVMTVFFATIMASLAVGQTFTCLEVFASARGAAAAVYRIIERVPDIDGLSTDGEQLKSINGQLEFRDVTFSYQTSGVVLKHFNLVIEPGQTVALVGTSGSGKSTCVKLLERLYDPTEGCIMLDGVSLTDLNVQWFRSQIGLVSQTPSLFAGTIAENIAMGAGLEDNPDYDKTMPTDPYTNSPFRRVFITRQQIEQAADLANASGFIRKLPQGLDTHIEGSVQLSGGQKQRIAIARAIVRNPKILILDEATSALDVTSEAIVQKALEKASAGRTTVVIAHRLTTVRRANLIAVLDEGVVKEQGSHEELMANNGRYSAFVLSQMSPLDNIKRPSSVEGESLNKEGVEGEAEAAKRSSYEEMHDVTAVIFNKASQPEHVKKIDKGVIARAFKLNAPEWPYYVLGSIGAMLAGIIWPIFAFVFGEILFVFISKETERVYIWIIVFMCLAAAAFIGHIFLHIFFGYANEKLIRRIRVQCFDAMLQQDIGFFDHPQNSVGMLANRLATDSVAVTGITGEYVAVQVMLWTTVIGALIIGLQACWPLALLMFCSIPVVGLATFVGVYAGRKAQKKAFGHMADANKTAGQAIDNIRTLTTLGASSEFMVKYAQMLEAPSAALYKSAMINAITYGIAQLAVLVIWGGAFKFGVDLIKEGQCSIEGMIRAFCAVVFGGMGLGQTAAIMPNRKAAQVAATWIFRLLDRVPLVDLNENDGSIIKGPIEGELQFSNIVFSYPTRSEVTVLNGLALTVPAGKTVALVGESGSGKSTMVSLLERFYTPHSGSVLLDGKEVSNMDVKWLRTQIGLVSQEPDLFTGTVRENILYGMPLEHHSNPGLDGDVSLHGVITDAALEDICRRANAWDFVSRLPNGLDTHIGDKGSALSGGQRQRIAIARALVRDPRILLLDEATSALDSQSERVVQEALKRAGEGRTTLVIAHRLSTIRDADLIAVLGRGGVIELGTHDQLLSQRGLYWAMTRQQAAAFE